MSTAIGGGDQGVVTGHAVSSTTSSWCSHRCRMGKEVSPTATEQHLHKEDMDRCHQERMN
jgi:hypothetical protein